MNILFIHASNIVEPATSGIIRVTATLKRIFEEHGHECHNAYYKEVPGNGRKVFPDSLKLIQGEEYTLLDKACKEWKLDTVICQTHPSDITNALLRAARQCEVHGKRPMVIQCIHCTPYIEVRGYTPGYLHYLMTGARMKLASRVKKVLWGLFCLYMPETARKKIARRYQITFNMADKVVLLSDKFFPEVQKYQQFGQNQLMFANNPITYDNAVDYADLLLNAKEKLVVFVGRLEEAQKRLSVTLDIWKSIEGNSRLADWRLDILGVGPDEEYYHRLAKKMHLNRVRFCGEQNPKEWYCKASVIMLTSACEGWGMVINEAQQMGVVPVVYDSYASVHDLIVDGEDGYLVPNLDKSAFVEKQTILMTDDNLRRKMQVNGMKNSGRYSEDVIYRQWERILLSS